MTNNKGTAVEPYDTVLIKGIGNVTIAEQIVNFDENVNHPAHYNSHPSGVECIDVVEHMHFNVGNAIKYLWRLDHKGNAIEQLEKAKWYIEREISLRKKGL